MTATTKNRIRGVLAPVVTPFHEDLTINHEAFAMHCRALLADGVGLALFGTNSEATSISFQERVSALETLIEAGLPAHRMMPGTGCCSLTETVELTKHAIFSGVAGVLMLPPYFYSEADEEGLFAYFSEVIERVGSSDLLLYLYHIPKYTQVAITPALVERLLARYPDTVAGYKDSSGDWQNTKTLLTQFATNGFDIFCASEIFLAETLRLGGAGCISATANVNAKNLNATFQLAATPGCVALQAQISQVREVFQTRPLIAAMKYFLAQRYKAPEWRLVRPPLTSLATVDGEKLLNDLSAISFSERE